MKSTRSPFHRVFLSALFLFIAGSTFAQQMAIGDWHIHLPYRDVITLSGGDGKVYAATESGLFEFTIADNSIRPITKVEGLSDITINTVNYNTNNHTLIVGYKDANIDLIRGTEIKNLPDIKRSSIVGNKTINSVYFLGNLAYVACGFGIVVVDMDRNEIKDTYYIGPNGSYITVYNIISNGTSLFASTQDGIYKASLTDPNLASFTAWSKLPNLPNGSYTHMAFLHGKFVVTFFGHTYNSDATYLYDLNSQTAAGFPLVNNNINVKDLKVMNNELYMAHNTGVFVFDTLGNLSTNPNTNGNIFSYGNNRGSHPNQLYLDTIGQKMWLGDLNYGLVKYFLQFYSESYYPNGPGSADVFTMDLDKNNLVVATGGKDDAWNNVFNREGFFRYKEGTWIVGDSNVYHGIDTIADFLSCEIDPDNPDHFFLGSWGNGLLEFNGGNMSVINASNSPLMSKPEYTWVGVAGIRYDTDKNLWVTNSHSVKTIQVRKPDGNWKAFDFSGMVTTSTSIGGLTIDKNGTKWAIIPRGGGVLVFNDNGTIDNTTDDKKRKLGFNEGNGHMAGTEVYCLAEDHDGEMWVGTDKGICVFYSPSTVFDASGFDAQQILIEQDGYVQILLETQVVTAMAIDGANRKWIGTESGGVFLMSADGTKQIEHFDTDNSPLLSNTITSIAINDETGEVFFGTAKGIVSYRGSATAGGETNNNVYAFPNPVRHDYNGVIAIHGVVNDADIKITDVRGNIVSQMKALGGQAIWDGKNFSGVRVASGVYYAFITNEDGSQKTITKILFIN